MLITATYFRHIDIVKFLISVVADIETKDNKGRTPLMHASIKEHLEIFRYLVSMGANIFT
ncbi:ankyrin repeat protein, putative [Trichomonas vaginalis G3]|uniref:Ankyrin repeat protein, putative n=1 Tax=Trichomonas vaginalis (strain ATCC PRA-98 / G3) TaxID=412133 RepID=A2F2Q2_TRIV3|nr:Ankyrin repeat family [Trichomonas vaginalis G3]EAY00826.1 ankyrin repeat protein, putative [Trichomonas vaginalis G3]KAI5492094.1 Ankyrin repeat family [Trichomonas vaginalis G3]|eukprot:XP_001313755.1 ankyrin repeat protein [Trichomonas vaginalis G3]